MEDLVHSKNPRLNPQLQGLVEYIPCDGGLYEISDLFGSIHLKQFTSDAPMKGCLNIGPTLHLERLSYGLDAQKPVVEDSRVRLVSYGLSYDDRGIHPIELSKIISDNRGLVGLLDSIVEISPGLSWDSTEKPFYLVKRHNDSDYFNLLMSPSHSLTRKIIDDGFDDRFMKIPKPIIVDN